LPSAFLEYPVGSIAIADYDDDGIDDLFLGEGYTSREERNLIHLLKGVGNGTFHELTQLEQANFWVTAGNFNNDEKSDFLVASSNDSFYRSDTVKVFLGNGDFYFQETGSYEIPDRILHTVQILDDMNMDNTIDIGLVSSSENIQFLYDQW